MGLDAPGTPGWTLNETTDLLLKKEFDECLYKDNNFHLLSACNGSVDLFDANFKFEELIIDIIISLLIIRFKFLKFEN